MTKSKVFFTREITPSAVVGLYRALGIELPGKVAVKLHSGEPGNQNFIHPDFWKPAIDLVGGTMIECNTAYDGGRNTTEKHLKTMQQHGWSDSFPVDILDAEGEVALPVHGGKHLTVNYVGDHMANYDSMLVLSHFKGHPMGGFGGALKNISIGLASSHGKAVIHGGSGADDSGIFPRKNGVYQCHVQHVGGLRLLRRCRRPQNFGHRDPCLAGSCRS